MKISKHDDDYRCNWESGDPKQEDGCSDDFGRGGINEAVNIDYEYCEKLQHKILTSVGDQTRPTLSINVMFACMMVAAKIGTAFSYPERRESLALVVKNMKRFFAWQDSIMMKRQVR